MGNNFYCVIMAGGIGSRFWPISRNSRPKQFLDILGTGRTFLQMTYDRFSKIVPDSHILVVTASQYKSLVMEQLPTVPEQNILLEPFRKNTAPCLAYAIYKLYQKDPKATMVVTPSDHVISNEHLFVDMINQALIYASKNNQLFTLGIKPTSPETSYGYIQMAVKEHKNIEGHIVNAVKTFTEKPNQELAQVFLDSGEFLWNSGIFIWNLETIKEEFEKWLPEITSLFNKGKDVYFTDKEVPFINEVYENCTSISIDYGIMEKTEKAWVFQASFGWSDIGTWSSLFLHSEKDAQNNFVKADENMMDKITNSIVVNTENGKLMAIKGLDNFMIINTKDVLMICPRDDIRFKNMFTDLSVKDKGKFQ